jgi:hypothetical protein
MVDQTRKRKIELVNAYMKGQLQQANSKLHYEADTSGKYDVTWQAGVKAEVEGHEANIIKMLRWLAVSEGFTVPVAYTDGEVDAINSEIRTQAV